LPFPNPFVFVALPAVCIFYFYDKLKCWSI
jgi:hypothetical protein